jgi:hypothetical protein
VGVSNPEREAREIRRDGHNDAMELASKNPDASWAQAQRRASNLVPPPPMSLAQHSRNVVELALASLRQLPDSVKQVHGAFYRTAIQAFPASLLEETTKPKGDDDGDDDSSSGSSSDSDSDRD